MSLKCDLLNANREGGFGRNIINNQITQHEIANIKCLDRHIQKKQETDRKTDQLNLWRDLPHLDDSWFYNRFERFTNQASGFAGGR